MCLIEECTRAPVSRGLCPVCYNAAKRKVDEGVTSWEWLESIGLAAHPKRESFFEKAFKGAGGE